MKKNRIILLLFLCGLVVFTMSFFQREPDYLWHIKAGEYMFHHGILTKDIFSWSVVNQYWMSHEWLFEIILYGLKQLFGNLHLFIYCFSCSIILMFTFYFANRKLVFNNILFTIFWFTFSLILGFFIQGRPHMISNIFLSLTVYFLYDLYKNENSKKLYFLPIITIFWANIHGGSSNLPYLLCFLFIIVGLFQFKFSKIEANRLTGKQFKKYIIVMFLCMIAVCLNVHGFKMFIYPYENMMDKTMLQNILEWRNSSLSDLTHYPYFALLLIIVFVFLFSKKKVELLDFVLFGFCTYLGLKSIRFWPYTYIIMTYIVFYYVGKRKEDKGVYLGMGLLSLMFIVMFSMRSQSIFHPKNNFLLSSKDIAIIQDTKPQRLFNMYNYGGDLVYQGIPVFIDGRADLYGKYNYKDYLSISMLRNDYVSLIKQYDFDYFLVDKNYSIATYLKYNDQYDLIYQNGDVYYYKKKN